MNESQAFTSFISTLMQSKVQAKIFHWQVLEEGSYAAHMALDQYDEDIEDLIDSLVESFQGRYGIVRNFKGPSSYREDNNIVPYFKGLVKYVEVNRYNFTQDTYIQNQVDEVVKVINNTLYRLQNLR